MNSNKKSLEMERISPIPAADPCPSFEDSISILDKSSLNCQKNTGPSSENGTNIVNCASLQKPRKCPRGRVSARQLNFTPLQWISKKTATPKFEEPVSSDNNIPPLDGCPDQPLIDDFSQQKPSDILRHAKILPVCKIFPQKPVCAASGAPRLEGIVKVKSNFPTFDRSIPSTEGAEDLSGIAPPVDDTSVEISESPRIPCIVTKGDELVHPRNLTRHQNLMLKPARNLIKHAQPVNDTSVAISESPRIPCIVTKDDELVHPRNRTRHQNLMPKPARNLIKHAQPVNDTSVEISESPRIPSIVTKGDELVHPRNRTRHQNLMPKPDRNIIKPGKNTGLGRAKMREEKRKMRKNALEFNPRILSDCKDGSKPSTVISCQEPVVDCGDSVPVQNIGSSSSRQEFDVSQPTLHQPPTYNNRCTLRSHSPVLNVSGCDYHLGSLDTSSYSKPRQPSLHVKRSKSPNKFCHRPRKSLIDLESSASIFSPTFSSGASFELAKSRNFPAIEPSTAEESISDCESTIATPDTINNDVGFIVASSSRIKSDSSVKLGVFETREIIEVISCQEPVVDCGDYGPVQNIGSSYSRQEFDVSQPTLHQPLTHDNRCTLRSHSPVLNVSGCDSHLGSLDTSSYSKPRQPSLQVKRSNSPNQFCHRPRKSLIDLESSASIFLPTGASFERAKSRNFPAIKPSTAEESISDCESTIANTPDTAVGFIMASSPRIKSDSSVKLCVFETEEILEETNKKSSWSEDIFVDASDESETDVTGNFAVKRPSIMTKTMIQSSESPVKFEPFSEAVINTFSSSETSGSGEDVPSYGTKSPLESPTEEYREESEQVRQAKRRKKGSLLERVGKIIAKVDASNSLFDYELKCGLRPTKGKSVSAPLVVLTKISSSFLICQPLKYFHSSPDLSHLVAVHVTKVPPGVCIGSVIVVHFPVNIFHYNNLHFPVVMAGHQIALDPTKKMDATKIDLSFLQSISYTVVFNKPRTTFKKFSSVKTNTLIDTFLCQNLSEEVTLQLTVLHVTRFYVGADVHKMRVLCRDEDSQFCWLDFSCEYDIKRAVSLESLNILSYGSVVEIKSFAVIDRIRLDRKSKNLISYCCKNAVNNGIIFIVRPKDTNWVISSTDVSLKWYKMSSSISELSMNKQGSRHSIDVFEEVTGPQILVKDSQGQSMEFVVGENTNLDLNQPPPFCLDGVYYYGGKLFSDEHTRVLSTEKKLHSL